jgi:hypothetical protein
MRLKFQKILEKEVLLPHETAQYTRIEDPYMEKRPRQQQIGIWGERIAKDLLSKQYTLDKPHRKTFECVIIQKQWSIIRGLLLAYLARHNNKLEHQFDLSLDWLLNRRLPTTTDFVWEEGLSQFKFQGKTQKSSPLSQALPVEWITGNDRVQQILSPDEYEKYSTFLSVLSKFIQFEKFKKFLGTEKLVQTFLPYAEIIVWHELDCWAKFDKTLPIYCIEIKSSDITCGQHSERGPISDRMGNIQREYIKRLMKLSKILKVLIAKVNFCECDHVYYWLIEVEPSG